MECRSDTIKLIIEYIAVQNVPIKLKYDFLKYLFQNDNLVSDRAGTERGGGVPLSWETIQY